MKLRNIKWSVFTSLVLCSFIGCKDALEVDRIGPITPEEMWHNADFVKFYVNDFYKILPAWNQMSNFSEEAASKNLSSFLRGINASSDDYPGREWPFAAVRSINVFLQNMESSKASLTEDEKKQLIGQAHFFRAMLYFKMVKTMGGVPIITQILDPTQDLESLQKPRNTTKECFDFILEELNTAINLLPIKGTANYENSRITKAAAMAYKGEVLLWKASPLFCKTKNDSYWEDAYKALKEAKMELDKEGYGLYKGKDGSVMDKYWYDKAGSAMENIIFVEYKYPAKANTHQQSQRPLTTSSGSAGGNQPTWEFVKAFPMDNGKSIADPSSGYDAKLFWKNRDPRFYSTIVYNGALYGIGNEANRRQWIFNGITDDGYLGSGYNHSGFYARKGIDTTLNQSVWAQQAFDWPVIRYSEVLLNLAEAANETGANRSDVVPVLTAIRDRVFIKPGANSRYGLTQGVGTDYSETLDAIMKERLVELAYEGKRFMDIRRRRMFNTLNSYKTFHAYGPYIDREAAVALNIGITINMSSNEIIKQLNSYLSVSNPNVNRDEVLRKIFRFSEDKIDANPDAFIELKEQNYFAPLKQDWIKKNPKLKQNAGWDNGDFNPVIQ